MHLQSLIYYACPGALALPLNRPLALKTRASIWAVAIWWINIRLNGTRCGHTAKCVTYNSVMQTVGPRESGDLEIFTQT